MSPPLKTSTGEHIGSTLTHLPDSPWRLVIHWHEADGDVYAAGFEVRCYSVDGDDEDDPWGGQDRPNHGQPRYGPAEHPQNVTGDLVGKRIPWSRVIPEHAGKLATWADDGAAETATLHPGSAAVFQRLGEAAGRLESPDPVKGRERDLLVNALHREAQVSRDHGQVALGVLRRLRDQHGFLLDEQSKKDRQKVQQWIYRAKNRADKDDE